MTSRRSSTVKELHLRPEGAGPAGRYLYPLRRALPPHFSLSLSSLILYDTHELTT